MQSSIDAPWSPIIALPESESVQRHIRCYVHWDKERKAYVAYIVPEMVERVRNDAGTMLNIRTCKSGQVRAFELESGVKRYNAKVHQKWADALSIRPALEWASNFGYVAQ